MGLQANLTDWSNEVQAYMGLVQGHLAVPQVMTIVAYISPFFTKS